MTRAGDTVVVNVRLRNDADTAVVTGKALSDLVGASLKFDGSTDKTSRLSMSEIGATGEYTISFTPDAAGHWSLIFREPAGTLGQYHRDSWDVLLER